MAMPMLRPTTHRCRTLVALYAIDQQDARPFHRHELSRAPRRLWKRRSTPTSHRTRLSTSCGEVIKRGDGIDPLKEFSEGRARKNLQTFTAHRSAICRGIRDRGFGSTVCLQPREIVVLVWLGHERSALSKFLRAQPQRLCRHSYGKSVSLAAGAGPSAAKVEGAPGLTS